MLHRSGAETAAEEAFEEAGVSGRDRTSPIGSFAIASGPACCSRLNAEVRVFPLRVDRLLDQWPEQHQRRRQWFSRDEAAAAVAERASSG